ncbi:MAG: hypothetical protein HZB87_13765 [Desulfatitalea sp.]|nr:hypothetical protein [Desulfatitalea sp.]
MIACPNCHTIQSVEAVNTGRMAPCPQCRKALRIDVFNAFLRRDEPEAAILSAHAQGQAECFYHPGQLAVVPCAACGRLLCAVCRVELEGRSLCMACLQAGRDKQKITAMQNRHVRYDEIALALSVWGFLMMIFPSLVTAPAAIYFAVRHWRTPSPVLPKSRAQNIVAVLLAGVQIIGWIYFLALKLGD